MFKIVVLLMIISIELSLENCVFQKRNLQYFKVKSCHKSELSLVGLKDVESLQDCILFSKERNGMAFNFSPKEEKILIGNDTYFDNCEVLGCPELTNSNTLVPDDKFDYYSAFGNMNTTVNATCIKSTGLFVVVQSRGNYTSAIIDCQNRGGDLADILSETRTTELANLINVTVKSWYKASYVGLDDIKSEGTFESSNGNLLTCTEFRAWGPGHPRSKRKSEDCVTLDVDKTWKVVPCSAQLTSICEFFPEPPPIDEMDMEYKCLQIKSKRKKRKCIENRRALKSLIESSTRMDKCALLNYDRVEIISSPND